MRDSQPPHRGDELAVVWASAVVVALALVTWLGARLSALASGGTVRFSVGGALTAAVRLVGGSSPSDAWGSDAKGLPSTTLYWLSTCVVLAAGVATFIGALSLGRRRRSGRRFGQDPEARQATNSDVRPLVVKSVIPPTGRMLLGRVAGHRVLLATEDRSRHPLSGRAARRQGSRGSVALIGPTGSGKTALAASAIATWDGPVVAVSVKRDLYDSTAAIRAQRGELAVFDPGCATNLPTARWTPLNAALTSSGALRTGRALAQAIPRSGVSNADYWAKHGEKLLGAFMCIAGLSRLVSTDEGGTRQPVSMEQLATWVTALAGSSEPRINALLRRGLRPGEPLEVALMARHAATTLSGIAKEDHKIRSSIYATAALALDPWLEPSVAHSATDSPRTFYGSDSHFEFLPRAIDLTWLMDGPDGRANTLYLTASQPEFERLSPVLGGLLADLKDAVHAWDIAGKRLEKPLLIVIDEAGQLELGWLPTEVSTIAALGAFFVTCWQSLSQVQHRYGSLADAVLSGHRTKCFFAGMDDLATVRYLSGLLGHEQVRRWTHSRDIPGLFGGRDRDRRSVSESVQREEFAPANALRQMYPGEAVLLHGTLPPIHLDAVRWWREPQLADLVPRDDEGNPVEPDDVRTCPLTEEPAREVAPAVDAATLASALRQLPRLVPDHAVVVKDDNDAVGVLAGTPDSPAAGVSHSTHGRCDLCGHRLRAGEGAVDRRGSRVLVRCQPSCIARRLAVAHENGTSP